MEIVYGVTTKLVTDLGSHVFQDIGLAMGVKKDLEKLKETVSIINTVLIDAEEQQHTNRQVKHWLRKIKDAAYEAEDILDDYATEALRRKLMVQGSTIKKVRSFAYSIKSVAFHFQMSSRIKAVGQKFDVIAKDKDMFKLTGRVHVDVREESFSLVAEPEVLGRDDDKDEIIKLLLDEEDKVSVIPIRGMGGLGKTTLAQFVYNDERVNTRFQSKMWVCVSEQFDVKQITKMIIKSATDNECPDLEMDQLQSRLQGLLRGKRFLLVLDDVWNENSERWDKLRFMLTSGTKGSKVLVTTRNENVAFIMGTIPTYLLKELSNDDCWKLFKQKAFARRQEEAHPQLVVIGKEIVKKCGGLPLAAKTLGSIMLFKTEIHEWELVRDNDIWRLPQKENDILPALRLSYNHLPFYLKQCFAFCSIYPNDEKIEKDNLIRSWIAQGFVHSSGDGQCLEDIGNNYVKELLWRSFFQEPKEDDYGHLIHFKVHDLVCDLARDVARIEYYFQNKPTQVQIPEQVRHVFVVNHIVSSKTLQALPNISNLRTLSFKTECLDNDFFSNFKCLRHLSLGVMSGNFPSSIGKLKHLRYLALASNAIEIFLPKSITKLQNLQTLDALDCQNLRELPKGLGNMINLRHICFFHGKYPLSHMPFGFSNLTSLRTFPVLVVGKGTRSKLNELYGLIHLSGSLIIENLENVSSAKDSTETNLKGKKKLEHLALNWNDQYSHGGIDIEENNLAVLETLEPHSNLKSLVINGYGGAKFPPWLMEPVFPILTKVRLFRCRKCEQLPPFGEIPSLEELTLVEFPNLEKWESKENSFLRLSYLYVYGCPKLQNMPMLPSLETLNLHGCSELVQSLAENNSSFDALKYLRIEGCNDLVCLEEDWLRRLQGLTCLEIRNCEKLTSLSDGVGYLISLETLTILKLPKLASLPEGIGNATQLKYLWIEECNDMIALPDGIKHLTVLQSLHITGCGLMSWPNWLGSLTWLRDLSISCSSMFLPEQMQYLSGLQTLAIENCDVLTTLPEWMVHFTSLRDLNVRRCRNLQYLPEWMKTLKTLQQLSIDECDQLTPRCDKGTGEDWPKIAHIPDIYVDCRGIQNYR